MTLSYAGCGAPLPTAVTSVAPAWHTVHPPPTPHPVSPAPPSLLPPMQAPSCRAVAVTGLGIAVAFYTGFLSTFSQAPEVRTALVCCWLHRDPLPTPHSPSPPPLQLGRTACMGCARLRALSMWPLWRTRATGLGQLGRGGEVALLLVSPARQQRTRTACVTPPTVALACAALLPPSPPAFTLGDGYMDCAGLHARPCR